jgi:hypothetical protein
MRINARNKRKLLYKHGGEYLTMRSPQEIRTVIEKRLRKGSNIRGRVITVDEYRPPGGQS